MRYLLFLSILLMSCVSQKQIIIDHEIDNDVSAFTHYYWKSVNMHQRDSVFVSYPHLRVPEIQSSIDRQMQKKGYQLSPSNPELALHLHFIIEDPTQPSTPNYLYEQQEIWYRSQWDGLRYSAGTFILDMVDIQSGCLIWRSRYIAGFKSQENPLSDVQLDAVIKKMISSLPESKHKLALAPHVVIN